MVQTPTLALLALEGKDCVNHFEVICYPWVMYAACYFDTDKNIALAYASLQYDRLKPDANWTLQQEFQSITEAISWIKDQRDRIFK